VRFAQPLDGKILENIFYVSEIPATSCFPQGGQKEPARSFLAPGKILAEIAIGKTLTANTSDHIISFSTGQRAESLTELDVLLDVRRGIVLPDYRKAVETCFDTFRFLLHAKKFTQVIS
jgi:hypothetical protein